MKSASSPGTADHKPSWENPLIPNKRLRQLYAAMAELRLLEEHLAKTRRRNPSLLLHAGEEGCLVSTVLSLLPGDFTSESSRGIAIEFLRGGKLTDLLTHTSAPAKAVPGELPPLADTSGRLHLVIGAAIALRKKLVVLYVHAADLSFQQWKPILKLAGNHAAPIFIVVLPHPRKTAKPGQLSLISTANGVPGIPVDAADPVALYRVTQESMLRIRAGGGPVLMECIPFQALGRPSEPADPILTMQQFMLPRGVANAAWFEAVAARFRARLGAAIK